MSTIIHFKHCKSLDEVKSEYKKLTQERLPRENYPGDHELMASVDKEYQEISQRPKFKQQSQEIQEEFLAFPAIVKELLKLRFNLEVCGSWMWVSGSTYDHTDKLKELGLKFSVNKRLWYYRPIWSRSTNSTPVSLDFIRRKYGSDTVERQFVFDKEQHPNPVNANNQGGGLPV